MALFILIINKSNDLSVFNHGSLVEKALVLIFASANLLNGFVPCVKDGDITTSNDQNLRTSYGTERRALGGVAHSEDLKGNNWIVDQIRALSHFNAAITTATNVELVAKYTTGKCRSYAVEVGTWAPLIFVYAVNFHSGSISSSEEKVGTLVTCECRISLTFNRSCKQCLTSRYCTVEIGYFSESTNIEVAVQLR